MKLYHTLQAFASRAGTGMIKCFNNIERGKVGGGGIRIAGNLCLFSTKTRNIGKISLDYRLPIDFVLQLLSASHDSPCSVPVRASSYNFFPNVFLGEKRKDVGNGAYRTVV